MRKDVGRSADALPSHTAEQTVSTAAETVEDLHDGDDGQRAGNEGGNVRVFGEEQGEVVAEGGVHGEVEDADEAEYNECLDIQC